MKNLKEVKEKFEEFSSQVEQAFADIKVEILEIKKDLALRAVKEAPEKSFSISPTAFTASTPSLVAPTSVPLDVREVVDTNLNKHFGASIEPLSYTQFQFTIDVPLKYSTARSEQIKDLGGDKRVKVLDASLGINGVREFVEKVWRTFSTDIQSLIVADRFEDKI